MTYTQRLTDRGRPVERKKNILDLLRLTVASVEIVGTRRQALDSVAPMSEIPPALANHRHSIFETSVVFEFSQLAREDFRNHGNAAVWERPLNWDVQGSTYTRSGSVDMALFSARRSVETRIEFGKSSPRPRARPLARDEKLEIEAKKLAEAHSSRRSFRGDTAEGAMSEVENIVILWEERDSRSLKSAKFTGAKVDAWLERCKTYATAASSSAACRVELEGVAGSSLMSFEADLRRSVFVAAYSVLPKE